MTYPQQEQAAFENAENIRALQNRLLIDQVTYVYNHSHFYRKQLNDTKLDPCSFRGLEDLHRLPLTEKSALSENPALFTCVGPRQIADLCQTSGTTSLPLIVPQTRSDLERLAYNESLAFEACGLTADDRVVIACAIGRSFMAGLAYYLGLQRIGATTLRTGSDSTAHILETIQRCAPTGMVCVPSLALHLAERLESTGVNPATIGIRRLVCIGEPIRNADLTLNPLGEQLAQRWQAQVFGTYASSEMATAFCDCIHGAGGHLQPELIVIEILDEAGNPVPDGAYGEVVATPLGVEGMPLLRFRTGDICRLIVEPCACGRNAPRLSPVLGRRNQMLKVRGCTIFPNVILSAISEINEIEAAYVEAFSDFALSDRVRVVVSLKASNLTEDSIAEALSARLRFRPEVIIRSKAEVETSIYDPTSRKPILFRDHRSS
jgi:phenylacetate-CoA ligase